MATPYTISEIIQIADISQYLWQVNNSKQSVFGSSQVDFRLPSMLYVESDILRYVNDAGSADKDAIANYVYSLCGKYAAKAQSILNLANPGVVATSTTLVTNTTPEPTYYTATGTEGNTITVPALINVPVKLLFRDARPYQKVVGAPSVEQFSQSLSTGILTFDAPLSAGEKLIWTT